MIFIIAVVTSGNLSGCSSSVGINESNSPKTTILTEEELDYFKGGEFFNGEYMNIRNQFLSSIYDKPEKLICLICFIVAAEPKKCLLQKQKDKLL